MTTNSIYEINEKQTAQAEVPEVETLTGLVLDPAHVAGTEVKLADTAYESIRAINHLTIDKRAIPAPDVYLLLGNLTCLGYALRQAISQISHALGESLNVYAVYEDDGGNREESVMHAMDAMHTAAKHAARLGALLEGAQLEIARQGYHKPTTTREGQ